MKELIVWLIHFPAGSVAILAVFAAFYYPKGSLKHRKAGQAFTVTMLIMLISGGIAGVLKGSADDVFLAALVFYTVFTAWLAARHHQAGVGALEYLSLLYIVIFALAALSIDREWDKVREPGVYTFYVIMAIAFAIGDLRNILLKGMKRTHRLARHIWRISFSIFWAALAFGDKIIKIVGSTMEQMTYVIVISATLISCILLYWLFRIYRGKVSNIPE